MSLSYEIETLREEIKRLTVKIVELGWRRVNLAVEVGKIKKTSNLPLEDPAVEKALEEEVLKLCNLQGIDRRFALNLLNLLISESKRLQRTFFQELSE
ncbi:chorismate mutase [Candidatus Bathyarchaeota archaeon]|nr:chorismate mutase [Candidatus Bathyarchaeota archaeon]